MADAPGPSRSQEMLAAAAKLFAANGYHNVTVDDIGGSLGVSGPALYHHFRSKEAVLSEILLGFNEGLVETARAEKTDDPRTTLQRYISQLVAMALEQPELIEIHKRELVHAPLEVQQQVRQFKAAYVQCWVEALCELGATDPTLAFAAAQAVIGLIISTPNSRGVEASEMGVLLSEMAAGALGTYLGDPLLFQDVSVS